MDKYVFVWNCCQPPCEAVSWNVFTFHETFIAFGQPPCEAVSWNKNIRQTDPFYGVSLLVRLWVEITAPGSVGQTGKSASLWGCELKFHEVILDEHVACQPPCEAVSWNMEARKERDMIYRQPPCEAVSWNMGRVRGYTADRIVSLLVRLWVEMGNCMGTPASQTSASLWGCELKYPWETSTLIRTRSASLCGCELK